MSVGRAEVKDSGGQVTQTELTNQIVNVADGTQAKDAVNKSQLDAVGTASATAQTTAEAAQSGLGTLDGIAAKYDSTTKDKLTLGGGTGGTTLGNVKAGTAATDAVNKSQLDAVSTASVKAQTTAEAAQSGLGTLDGIAAKYDSTVKDKLTLGGGANGTTLGNVKAGTAATDAVNKSQLDAVSTASVKAQTTAEAAQSGLGTLDGIAAKYDSTTKDKLTLGGGANGTTLGNVKAGTAATDAVNKSQLDAVSTASATAQTTAEAAQSGLNTLDGVAAKYDSTTKDKLTLGGGTDGTTLGNVKAGTAATDAVNKSQLDAVSTASVKAQTTAEAAQSGLNTLDGIAAKYDSTAKDKLTLGGGTGGTTLGNVKAGTAATDAVNKSQLDAVSTASVKAQTTAEAAQSGLNTLDGIAAKYDSTAKDKLTLGGGTGGTTLGNVKAGTAATDAVNKSQLDAVSTASVKAQTTAEAAQSGLNTLDGIAAKYDSTAKDKLTLGGGTGGTTLGNVKAGTAATDAVNKSQLDAVSTASVKAQTTAEAAQSGLNTLDGIAAKYDSTTKDKLTLGGGANGTTLTNIKAGGSATDAVNVTQLQGITGALGGDAAVNPDGTLKAPSYVVQGTTVNNVGAALSSLDTVTTKNTRDITKNVGDITNLTARVNSIDTTSIGLVQQDATSKTITVAKSLAGAAVDFSGTAGARQLNGIAAGTIGATSTDAVNGSQLHVTATSLAGVLGGGATVNSDGSVTMPRYTVGGATVRGVDGAITKLDERLTQDAASMAQLTTGIDNGVLGLVRQDKTSGNILVANGLGGQTVSFAGTQGLRVVTGVASGKSDSDVVTVAQLRAVGLVDPNGRAMGAVVYDDLGLGRITLGGTNGTVLGSLANGLIAPGSREAVNGGQLHTLQQNFQQQYDTLHRRVDDLNAQVKNSGGQGGGNDNELVKTGRGIGSLIVGLSADASGDKDIAVGSNAAAHGDLAMAVGPNALADGDESMAVGSNASAAGDESMALGPDASAPGRYSIAMGQGSIADRDNTVSVGSKGHERQVTNVAPGTAPTDAVNVQQLQGVLGQVSDVARRAYSGVAMAMAMTGAYLPPLGPGEKTLGVGVGGYKGYGALAVNFKALANNGRLSWGAGVSSSGHDVGFNAGAGWKW
ncbi:YadA-like family protein [Paraburkholderia hayleyella]|uniref:YadA-like family protein n=1 Tax=Paraburkholderia hayleyella TaxID=2152889 RepID=UPI0015810604|nr:YadA-like family protein [Paraburkholderia hayleyella]